MSISNVTSANSIPQGVQNLFQQRRQDWSQLAQALQSNDLAGAQKAYADLQSLQPNNQQTATANSTSGGNPIQSDFAALGQALTSGNLSQAQSDFAQLQSDLKSAFQNQAGSQGVGGTHRGRHHHHHSASSSQESSSGSGGVNLVG
ncbi:MAG: hypothetical protein LAP40_25815 [Acidobacteriia bacterium]|nr:hypothetical protein [Terriglobia bacterium]